MKALEGYFDNLTVAAVNEQCLLEQLMANNTKLAANKESLVVRVKKLNGDSRNLSATTHASIRADKSAAGVQPSATIARRKDPIIQTHATSSQKTRTSAPLVGEACCDGVGRSE